MGFEAQAVAGKNICSGFVTDEYINAGRADMYKNFAEITPGQCVKFDCIDMSTKTPLL